MRQYPEQLRADFRSTFNVDILDLGRGRLSLAAAVAYLRALLGTDSALARAYVGRPVWQTGDYLVADLFHALTGKPHPGKPKPPPRVVRDSPRRRASRAAALARKRSRDEWLAQQPRE